MKTIKRLIDRNFRSDGLPIETKRMNTGYIFAMIAAVLGMVTRMMMGANVELLYVVLGIILCVTVALTVYHRYKLYGLGAFIIIVSVCYVMIPLLYFYLGGVGNSAAFYFIIGITVIYIMIRKKAQLVAASAVYAAIIGACHYINYLYPAEVVNMGGSIDYLENIKYIDSLQTLLVISIFICAVIKYQQRLYETELKKTREHGTATLMIRKSPFSVQIWNKKFELIDCNDESVRLYGFKDKKEYLDKFIETCSPEYQPNGQRSRERAVSYMEQTFECGYATFNWMQQRPDGTPIPTEVTLVRSEYNGKDVVIGYIRDMREHNEMVESIIQRDKLLQTVYQISSLLLVTNKKEIEVPILKSMELIGCSLGADRVHIWRNEKADGEMQFAHYYEWLSGVGVNKVSSPMGVMMPYARMSDWESKFMRNEHIGGPISGMTADEQAYFKAFDIKTVYLIPLHLNEEFWGLISIDDCSRERVFSDEEISILRSVSLMMASMINRSMMMVKMVEANERTILMLNTSPMCAQVWDKDLNMLDCNDAAVFMYGFRDKNDFFENFINNCSPEYQPDGRISVETAVSYLAKAFKEGYCQFEWMHQLPDGSVQIPTEITLVRTRHSDGDVVVGYTRDLREQKQMLDSIRHKNNLMQTVNTIATLLMESDVEAFEESLQKSMDAMAAIVKVDCIYIWKNCIKDGELYCSQLFEWSKSGSVFPTDEKLYKYSETFPGWDVTLTRGEHKNGPLKDMPAEVQDLLANTGIESILVIPIMIKDKFWGFIGFDDLNNVRTFTQDEENLLHSASMLIANAFIRNEITHDVMDKSIRLEKAIIEAYEANEIKNNSLESMESILNSIDANIYATIPETGELLFINTNMKNTFGIQGDEAIGKYCYKVFRQGFDEMCHFCPCLKYDKHSDKTVVWDEYVEPLGIHVRHSDCYINWYDGTRVHLQHAVDITELVKATERAQAASRAKSNFLANMSHEMRTPLNAIVGMTMIGLKADAMEPRKNALNKINDASAHLLGIISNILDMAKIEANKLELIPVRYELRKMLQNVFAVVQFRAEEKRQRLSSNIDARLPRYVIGDDKRLAQAIANILSNAVKFTGEGGWVSFGISLAGETENGAELLIEIEDNGIGISPDQQEKMFEAFEQVESGMNREYEGTGLGLAITKRIVEMMDGRIWVESALGKGAKFMFTVRVENVPSDEAATGAQELKRDLAAANSFAGKRILVAEDIEINREILAAILTDMDIVIDCAENGRQAVDMVAAAPELYDIVFMDLQMPAMGGIEATKLIRALPERARGRLPIVAMTANVFKDDIELCMDAGMDDHIGKPLDVDRIMEVLDKYLK
jgi:signal transduction histidine kinase/CheY-like chemotaxis protein/Ca2+/Na+ antiporter